MSEHNNLVMRDITIEATDGHPLAASLFSGDADGPIVLISSAAAVRRGFYRRFAEYLVSQRRFRAALTYDYRGVSGSATPANWRIPPTMLDWAEKDFPAALARLTSEYSGHDVVGVGQSFGGQVLGLGGRHTHFLRYATVATMTGYWGNTAVPYKVFATMNMVGVPLALLTGRVPGWTGLGETLPGTIFRQWARWGRNPEYFFADKTLDIAARFAKVTTPILAIGAKDDPWATPQAQEALLKYYNNAPIERRWIDPLDAGAPIGHLGFFRATHKDRLWGPVADWLESPKA